MIWEDPEDTSDLGRDPENRKRPGRTWRIVSDIEAN